jgi:inactivated superfamily I helicase
MSASDLAIVATLVFVWGTLSARLERFDVTAPITFVLAAGFDDQGTPQLPERRLIRRAS